MPDQNGGCLVAEQGFSALPAEAAAAVASGSFADGEEGFKSFGDVTLHFEGSRSEGTGRLLVTTRRLIWLSQEDPTRALGVGYKSIMVHAISRDLQAFDRPCIYVQIDTECMEGTAEDEEEAACADSEVSELRLAPADPDQLEEMFQALSDCAALNPDSDIEEDEGEFFYNEEEVLAGVDPERREAMLEHFNSILQPAPDSDLVELIANDPERFEDAEDEEGSPAS